jgi:hypothetical protein
MSGRYAITDGNGIGGRQAGRGNFDRRLGGAAGIGRRPGAAPGPFEQLLARPSWKPSKRDARGEHSKPPETRAVQAPLARMVWTRVRRRGQCQPIGDDAVDDGGIETLRSDALRSAGL